MPALWRPRLGRLVPHGLLPVVVACLTALGLVMAPSIGADDMLVYAIIGAAMLAGLYRLGRPKLRADERGLTVVNVWRRYELAWAQVIDVTMPEGEPWPTLDLADGTTLATMGIQAADGERARRALAELRVLLDERATTGE